MEKATRSRCGEGQLGIHGTAGTPVDPCRPLDPSASYSERWGRSRSRSPAAERAKGGPERASSPHSKRSSLSNQA